MCIYSGLACTCEMQLAKFLERGGRAPSLRTTDLAIDKQRVNASLRNYDGQCRSSLEWVLQMFYAHKIMSEISSFGVSFEDVYAHKLCQWYKCTAELTLFSHV